MILVSRNHRFLGAVVAVVAAGWFASAAGAAIIIFGGPTYDSTTQTGYQNPQLWFNMVGDGVALGYAEKYDAGSDKGWRAVRWDASGTTATELGNLGTDSNGVTATFAGAINAAGTAVGLAEKYLAGSDVGERAVRWDASGTAATELGNLGTVGGYTGYNRALDINAPGTAVGSSAKYVMGSCKGSRAVRWDASGTAATELGNLGTDADGYTVSGALGINTAGTSVGYADKYVSGSYQGGRAVRWDASGTAATELGNLGTANSGFTGSYATAVNATDLAVGYAAKYDSGGIYVGDRVVA
jgi:hypothetical protein